MTVISVCTCGNNHDAYSAAMRLFAETTRDKGECPVWKTAVAEAYLTMNKMAISAHCDGTSLEGMDGQIMAQTEDSMLYALYKDPELAKRVADTIMAYTGENPKTRAEIEAGPMKLG
jgi:hypothetical protein